MRSKHSVLFGLAAGMVLAAVPALAAEGDPAKKEMDPKKIESTKPTTPNKPDTNRGMPELGTEKPAQDAPRSDVGNQMREKVDPMRDGTPVRAGGEYTVEKGDTLGDIAEKKLGSRDQWRAIAKANDIDDPNALRVGQKLRIPARGPQ